MGKTIRVIEHLSYVMECALLDYMGDAKTELFRLIESLKNNESYSIDQNIAVAGQLQTALDHYCKRDNRAGNSKLSSAIRALWKRIMDGRVNA